MYSTDWLIRQIESMARGIAKILFDKDTSMDMYVYDIMDRTRYTEPDILHDKLKELLIDLKLNEAEDLLFDNIDTENKNYLLVALDFYIRLNELDDDTLEKNNFSRDEIYSGMSDVKEMYGINF